MMSYVSAESRFETTHHLDGSKTTWWTFYVADAGGLARHRVQDAFRPATVYYHVPHMLKVCVVVGNHAEVEAAVRSFVALLE